MPLHPRWCREILTGFCSLTEESDDLSPVRATFVANRGRLLYGPTQTKVGHAPRETRKRRRPSTKPSPFPLLQQRPQVFANPGEGRQDAEHQPYSHADQRGSQRFLKVLTYQRMNRHDAEMLRLTSAVLTRFGAIASSHLSADHALDQILPAMRRFYGVGERIRAVARSSGRLRRVPAKARSSARSSRPRFLVQRTKLVSYTGTFAPE